MSVFTSDQNEEINTLLKILKDICSRLEARHIDKNLYAKVLKVVDYLEAKDVENIKKTSLFLYDDYKILDQSGLLSDDLSILMHKTYKISVQSDVFQSSLVSDRSKARSAFFTLVHIDDDAWRPYRDKNSFLDYITPLEGHNLATHNTEVKVRDLSFFPGAELIDVKHNIDFEGRYLWCHFIKFKDELIYLDKNVSPLYELSNLGEFHITKDNVLSFMKFFEFFTVSQDDPNSVRSFLLEDENSEFLKGISKFEKSRYFKNFSGTKIVELENNIFEVHFRYVYKDSVFDGVYKVPSNGKLKYINSEIGATVKPLPW